MKTLDHILAHPIEDLAVLLRVDFNVPMRAGKVLDSTRLVEALPTISELRRAGTRVVLVSHRGRPRGEPDPSLSLEAIVPILSELLDHPVRFAADCIGDPALQLVSRLAAGDVGLLENVRFHAGEEANTAQFAAALAEIADLYVNDAFGTAHRAHASTAGVTRYFERRAAGRLLEREVKQLGRLLGQPARPFVAIVGGAKISGKIDTLTNLLPRLDRLLLGGGMANTLLTAQGRQLGKSLVETEALPVATELLIRAERLGVEVLLPEDLVITSDLEQATDVAVVPAVDLPAQSLAVDVGPRTRERFAAAVADAQTLFWNGPLGVFERPPFDRGTLELAHAIMDCPGFSVIGGGETVAAARASGALDRIGHVSTGGGASLALLAGKILPGVEAIDGPVVES